MLTIGAIYIIPHLKEKIVTICIRSGPYYAFAIVFSFIFITPAAPGNE